MPAQFVPMSTVAPGALPDWQSQLLNGIKENVELLIGQRGSASRGLRAVTSQQINVDRMDTQSMRQVRATGAAFSVTPTGASNTVALVSANDYILTVQDLQTLANDLAETRAVINALIRQLRG